MKALMPRLSCSIGVRSDCPWIYSIAASEHSVVAATGQSGIWSSTVAERGDGCGYLSQGGARKAEKGKVLENIRHLNSRC